MPLSSRPVVLVAADDPHTLETIRSVLGEAGYALEEARDSKQALEAVRRNDISLVLIGWQLGAGAQRGESLVRKLRDTGSMPVIALSNDANALREAGAALVDDYLPTPLQPEDLLHVVDEHCRIAAA